MTLEPIDPIVDRICEYFDGVFTLQHTVPQDRIELAKILSAHINDHAAMEAMRSGKVESCYVGRPSGKWKACVKMPNPFNQFGREDPADAILEAAKKGGA